MNPTYDPTPTQPVGGYEVAPSAAAALAKATIEAKFTIALRKPRNEMDARNSLLAACRRPLFAAAAIYAKPVGGQSIEGLSIRFAETALQAWRNVDVSAVTGFEDENKRLVRITVTDLETNLSFTDEVLLAKTVERRSPQKGAEILGERQNSKGERVFIIRATEDDLQNKLNAAKSKSIRNSGLRLIPHDILEECEEVIRHTRENGGADPKEETKKLCDAFSGLNISPGELERFLGHALANVSRKELAELRTMFVTIRDGEASWIDYIRAKESAQPSRPIFTAPTAEVATPKLTDDELAAMDKAEQHWEAKMGLAPAKPATEPTATMPIPAPSKPSGASEAPKDLFTPPKASKTPQNELAECILGAGFSFAQFKEWASGTGNLPDSETVTEFNDLAATRCRRLLASKAAMLKGMANGGAK